VPLDWCKRRVAPLEVSEDGLADLEDDECITVEDVLLELGVLADASLITGTLA
jgi:hypothetical protein